MSIRRAVLTKASVAGLLLALALLNGSTVSAQEYSYARVVRLSLVEGDVQVLRPEAETSGWEEALANLPIRQGYALSSARGRVEVEFESGATARMADYSTLEFTELALADGNRLTRLLLQKGTATFYANVERGEVFVVSTADVQVEVTRDARFRVDALDTGTAVTLLKGDAQVHTSAGSHRVTKGQTLLFQEGAADKVSIARNREPDEWDRWVADRDDAIESARADAQRYVDTPFRYGLSDLSRHGSWFVDSSYGYVWQPYGIGHGWSPYWQGRWVYVYGVGWTWLSYEPWGWVPYHYGRWAFTRRFGWVWVPSGFHAWHPALVLWFQFPGRVGWCPIGPSGTGSNVVIVNTPGGATGGSGNDVRNLDPDERPLFVPRSPLPPRGGTIKVKNEIGDAPPRQTETNGAASGPTGSGETANTNPAVTGTQLRPGDEPGIVYDPEEKKWVTNPRGPKRPVVEGSLEDNNRPAGSNLSGQPREGRNPLADAPANWPRGFESRPGDAPPRSSEGPAAAPPRFGTPPRTAESPRNSRPRMDTPRGDTSRPASTPRNDAPRSSPPRIDSPRPSSPPPSSPPPRVDSPRPSPSSGGGASPAPPRPSPPPPPPPRSDPPPKSGGRPNTN
jgi:hypothetical protein